MNKNRRFQSLKTAFPDLKVTQADPKANKIKKRTGSKSEQDQKPGKKRN
jgi:hypothetical protein